MTNDTDNGSELLTTKAAADVLGFKPQTLSEWRTKRIGPPFLKMGYAVRYRLDDLTRWMDESRVATG